MKCSGRLCEDAGQMTGSPPIGTFACDAGSLQELMADRTIACPCCNGPLTAEKLARLLADVQRLAAVGKDQPHSGSNGASRNQHAGIIIDPHAHMISRTTDDYEAMARAGIVAWTAPHQCRKLRGLLRHDLRL